VILLIVWAFVIGYAIYWGIRKARQEVALMRPVASTEKPGRIYFLQHQNNPDRIKIVKSKSELATPLKVVHELLTPTPNAVLAQIYRDLEPAHLGAGWYDADSVRMFLDSLRGAA
jgi:hypothetical protein